MNFLRVFALFGLFLFACPASAGPYAESLTRCFADNTSGKDRKDLARWIFSGIAAHPEIRGLSGVPKGTSEQASRAVGALFTRLIADNCPNETRALIRNEGSDSLKLAFEFLGKLAMQELMTSPEVGATISAFEQYVDRERVAPILIPGK